jgi:hypothetical protein
MSRDRPCKIPTVHILTFRSELLLEPRMARYLLEPISKMFPMDYQCAPKLAVFNAISNGHRLFRDLALVTSSGKQVFPCGACLQVLAEFSPDIRIYLEGNEQESFKLSDLLPHTFKTDLIQKK